MLEILEIVYFNDQIGEFHTIMHISLLQKGIRNVKLDIKKLSYILTKTIYYNWTIRAIYSFA